MRREYVRIFSGFVSDTEKLQTEINAWIGEVIDRGGRVSQIDTAITPIGSGHTLIVTVLYIK